MDEQEGDFYEEDTNDEFDKKNLMNPHVLASTKVALRWFCELKAGTRNPLLSKMAIELYSDSTGFSGPNIRFQIKVKVPHSNSSAVAAGFD